MHNKNITKKGFTLIELLVVIAILAVLMVVVVITLNPSELLKQSRDSNRLSDMASLKTAISLYQTDVATTTNLATAGVCYASAVGATCVNTAGVGQFVTVSSVTSSTNRTVAGSGWIPVNLSLISSGAPLSQLPLDPVNNVTPNFYGFEASGTSAFKLTMTPESVKFKVGGGADVTTNDGGNFTSTYETGPGVNGATGL